MNGTDNRKERPVTIQSQGVLIVAAHSGILFTCKTGRERRVTVRCKQCGEPENGMADGE